MTEEKLCIGTTKSGNLCKNKALPESDYCFVPAHQALGVQEKALEDKKETEICGHVNVHSHPSNPPPGIERDIPIPIPWEHDRCDQPAGHDGSHSCMREEWRVQQGDLVGHEHVRSHWTKDAGTPPEDIVQGTVPLNKIQKLLQQLDV